MSAGETQSVGGESELEAILLPSTAAAVPLAAAPRSGRAVPFQAQVLLIPMR